MGKRFKPSVVLRDNDVTDEAIYRQRRRFLAQLGGVSSMAIAGALSAAPSSAQAFGWFSDDDSEKTLLRALEFKPNKAFSTAEAQTAYEKVTSHNNFYEFGTSKSDPAERAGKFNPEPWQLKIDGLVKNPIVLDYDALFSRFGLEERIYRLRCVEAWSMVIPWIGFELGKLIAAAEPLGSARYVAFETLYDPDQMPGQRNAFIGGGIDYPYVEGLRLDEAMHPLSFMAVGLYGKTLPNQNGAPIRLVVPWKYGFKSIKSIVRIRLLEHQPPTTWQRLAAHEYGFYANVNPQVDHPRWSQASERRITRGGLFSQQRIATEMFNGYQEVAPLYQNMDLTKFY